MNFEDCFLLSQARADVVRLPIYDAGVCVDSLEALYGSEPFHNLAVNENPFGMSAHAQMALGQAVKYGAIYPDSGSLLLREKIAQRLSVPADTIIAGNGSEDILELVCKAFINSGDKVVLPRPTFSLHHIYADMMGAEIIRVSTDQSLGFNASAWISTLASMHSLKLLMLSNPSNPVGCILTHNELEQIISACPEDTLLLIDEAYVEFAAHQPEFPKTLDILSKQPRPWIVLRTFSKAYGLAGLRVGYGICSSKTFVEILDRVRTPYNVNRLAQVAAIHALDDHEHLAMTVNHVCSERERMSAVLASWGLTVAPSSTNFLFIDTQRSSQEVAGELFKANILVKAWKEAGFDTFIRVTIGRAEQNQLVLEALKAALEFREINHRRHQSEPGTVGLL